MSEYLSQVDEVAIKLYEANILPDDKLKPPEQSKQELDAMGCVLNSNYWNETISCKEVLYKMMSDVRMEVAWTALKKRAREYTVPPLFYIELCIEISKYYSGPDDWSLLTPKEKKQKMDKVSKLALALCKEIANTPLDIDVMGYVNDKYYFDYFKMRCHNKEIRDEIDFGLNLYCKLQDRVYVSAQDDIDDAVGLVWSGVGVRAPDVKSLLQDIHYKAKSVTYDSVIKRKSQIKRAFFIRKLSSFFQKKFGTPLHNITAAISSVFLDEEISIEEVRSTIR